MAVNEYIIRKYKQILGYVGTVTILVGIALLVPLTMIIFYPDEFYMWKDYFIPALLALIFGFLLKRGQKNGSDALAVRDGGIVVILSWIIAIVFSAMPFILSGQLNFTQAIFECVSGWTTTGLSVVNVLNTTHVTLFWRSLMQYLGGAGLIVIMLTAIIGPHGMELYNAEARTDKLLPNIKKTAKMIMTIYTGYIIGGTILYVLFGMNWFDAINHSIAAVSTGGFSTKPGSIYDFHSQAIEIVTIILMILGTINFAAHYLLFKKEIKSFFKIGEIRFMFFILAIAIPLVAFSALYPLYHNLGKSLRVAIFELTSALTTTGFTSVPSYTNWPDIGIFIMIILMLIGGGTGSTAGGLKQYRVYVLLKSTIWNIKNFLLPKRNVRQPYVIRPEGKYYVNEKHISEVSYFTTIYLLTFVIGTIIIMTQGYSLRDSMFEFSSALGTVGLSVGITGATAPVVVLWTEIFGMFLGRLEFFVIFYSIFKMISDIKQIRRKI